MAKGFFDLTECPFCGCKSFTRFKKLSYRGQIVTNFETKETKDEYAEDKLEEEIGAKAYCADCGEWLGNARDGKPSRKVRLYFEEREPLNQDDWELK